MLYLHLFSPVIGAEGNHHIFLLIYTGIHILHIITAVGCGRQLYLFYVALIRAVAVFIFFIFVGYSHLGILLVQIEGSLIDTAFRIDDRGCAHRHNIGKLIAVFDFELIYLYRVAVTPEC